MMWDFSEGVPKPWVRTKEQAKYYKEHPEEDIYNGMDFWCEHLHDPKIQEMSDEEIMEYEKKWILENCDLSEYD